MAANVCPTPKCRPITALAGLVNTGADVAGWCGYLVFMLLLSWILIPILLFRHRAKIKAWQQRQQAGAGNAGQSAEQPRSVIEGEVLNKREE
jgi:hypothetical protein